MAKKPEDNGKENAKNSNADDIDKLLHENSGDLSPEALDKLLQRVEQEYDTTEYAEDSDEENIGHIDDKDRERFEDLLQAMFEGKEIPFERGPGRPSETDALTHYYRGNARYEEGDYKGAIESYNKAIELNPRFSEAYFNRGLSYYNLNEFDISIKDYTKAADLDPRNPVIYNNRGDAHYRKQDFDSAIDDYACAIKLNSRYLKAFYNRGLAFACLQEYKTSIKDFDKVIELNPEFSEAFHIRGLAYDYLEATEPSEEYADKAVADYKKAIELNHDFFEAYLHLGMLYKRKEMKENAKIWFRKLIEIAEGSQAEGTKNGQS